MHPKIKASCFKNVPSELSPVLLRTSADPKKKLEQTEPAILLCYNHGLLAFTVHV